ncbi:MAG: helix-turn-helix domain-containing protein [Sphingomonadaceae bacterium]|nr:helix-turn-helix domain-containing protein [Sphingomonadaceae bacterium]
MATALHEKKIKSADRVLEIFEMFGPDRQSLTVMEVSRALDVPQSSTSELLGNLVRRGYLTRERGARAFRPTVRVALLGAWVHPTLFRDGRLLPMMDHLQDQTGFAVSLSSMIGVSLKHVHTTTGPLPQHFDEGREAHLLHSPFGHVLLSLIRGDDVRKVVHRLNVESTDELHVRHQDVITALEQVNRQGYAFGRIEAGWSGIAVLLPQGIGEEPLALGLIGRTQDMEARREDLIRTVRQGIAQYLGPRVARDTGEVRAASMH